MENEYPLVTIVMPVRNCEKTIAVTLSSIFQQTFNGWEMLIIDDGSDDDTITIARSLSDSRVRILCDGNHKGLPARLNQGIDLCTGKYLARMDGDDIAYPNRLERQLEFMESQPTVHLIGSWMLVFGHNGLPIGKRTADLGPIQSVSMLRSIPIGHPTFFGRTHWFKNNRYYVWPKHFQDQHLLLRTFHQSRFYVLPELLLGYREEELFLKKQLKYRLSYLNSLPNLAREVGLYNAFLLIASQGLKMGLDFFAISTRLRYRLLRYRAIPITAKERGYWERVWQSVNSNMPKHSNMPNC